jgi:hypothetical protein
VTEAVLLVFAPCATIPAAWSLAVNQGWGHWTAVFATAGAALAAFIVMYVILFRSGKRRDSGDEQTSAPPALPLPTEREEPQESVRPAA